MRGLLAVLQSGPDAASRALDQAVAGEREAGQLRLLAESLSVASIAENMAGDRASARRLLDEAQVMTTSLADLPATLMLLQARTSNGQMAGDLDGVVSASSEGDRLGRQRVDLYSLDRILM